MAAAVFVVLAVPIAGSSTGSADPAHGAPSRPSSSTPGCAPTPPAA